MPIKVIFLIGPTGAGKTEVSIALAKKIDAEIICCDSMQIYNGLDILTGKPTTKQMARVPHYLFSIKNPIENFSVAEYRRLALKKIKEIHNEGKTVIFVGGTGLYMQALLDGLFPSPGPDARLRKRLQAEAEKYGIGYLYERLKRIDPKAAAIIHHNDLRRIIRALEVYYSTGKTISQSKLNSSGGIFKRYDTYLLCVYYKNRTLLYDRINKRVEAMFKKGLVDEIRTATKTRLSMTASQMLGIKHIENFIKGDYNLDQAKELLKLDTRRYAKRQLSWFRRDKRIKWIALDECKDIKEVVNTLFRFTFTKSIKSACFTALPKLKNP